MQRAFIQTMIFGGLLCGCTSTNSEIQLAAHHLLINKLQQENLENTAALRRLAANLENIERSWSSEKLCKSAKLADFMKETEAALPDACQPTAFEICENFLKLVPYVNLYIQHNGSISDISITRKEYLKDLLNPKYIRPSTRLLVLVQPAGQDWKDQQEAFKLGDTVISMIRTQILQQDTLRIIETRRLPCQFDKILHRFRGPLDTTLPNEPSEGTPRIRIWVFRTDC